VTTKHRAIPYLPIERHGLIGDRRTAGLVAADGTLNWLCLPDYDSATVFGALLDARRGGFWRVGPANMQLGLQRYHDESAALVTSWTTPTGDIELIDVMAWPERERATAAPERRVMLRRMRCTRGQAELAMQIEPHYDFGAAVPASTTPGGLVFDLGAHTLGFWSSFPVTSDETGAGCELRLSEDEIAWAVLSLDQAPEEWSVEQAEAVFATTVQYWHDWLQTLTYTGPRRAGVLRSAQTIHLLSYAPTGALVAAPTTSLPERIGGALNWDYRYAWVRDASLSMALLSVLGETETAHHYMDWLIKLDSETDSPLQVMYGIDGRTSLPTSERPELTGYRGSGPVQVGNRAYNQRQLDSLGFFGECALVFLEHGGVWHDDFWDLLRRAADYTATNWQQADSGIWELPEQAHYVSSKVMSWVTLKRAVQIAGKLGRSDETDHWRATMETIHAEVMERGWSEHLQSFRAHYDADTLDASALLIAVMGFLPADHPRVVATVKRIVADLTVDGLVHRYVPAQDEPPLGEFEGAFLPCVFWLVTTYAKQGRTAEAEALLDQIEALAGELGLFAEQVDARQNTFLGNYPLIFSHVEYIQAVIELAKAKPASAARFYVGAAKIQARRLVKAVTGRPAAEEPE